MFFASRFEDRDIGTVEFKWCGIPNQKLRITFECCGKHINSLEGNMPPQISKPLELTVVS